MSGVVVHHGSLAGVHVGYMARRNHCTNSVPQGSNVSENERLQGVVAGVSLASLFYRIGQSGRPDVGERKVDFVRLNVRFGRPKGASV